jgi:hypothetical protein
MGPHRALADITGQSNSPPQSKASKRGVRFQDEPPEQIPGWSEPGAAMRAAVEKDATSTLYASSDALLGNHAVAGQENDPTAASFLNANTNLFPLTVNGGANAEAAVGGISNTLVNDLAAERTAMRSEADKIAERLLQTELVSHKD